MERVLSHGHAIFTKELPELLQLASAALKQKAGIMPVSVAGWLELSAAQWLEIGPFLSAALFVVLTPFLLAKPHTKRTYWLTRILLLRALAVVYLAAFATSALQGRALFGSKGIFPLDFSLVTRPTPAFGQNGLVFADVTFELVCWAGLSGSLLMLYEPASSYLSIVNLGTIISNYGWEWLTLELGFLAIFLCPLPLFRMRSFSTTLPPPTLIIWLFRWCAFRLLIGAGMSKLGRNSSACWQEFTCTTTHYETQPMPNPLAWYAHHLPVEAHQLEVAITFIEQLLLPWLLLLPCRSVQVAAALTEVLLQAAIVLTGNYAWINFAGALPCLAALDDQFLRVFVRSSVSVAAGAAEAAPMGSASRVYRTLHSILVLAVTVLIGVKSVEPLKELFGPAPWLHYYDDYFLVNSQGVFGFINKERTVLALSYTHDTLPASSGPPCEDRSINPGFQNANGQPLSCQTLARVRACQHPQHGRAVREHCLKSCGVCHSEVPQGVTWSPLSYKNLPSDDLAESPGFNSPYHHRFDWEVWIHTTASMDGAKGQQPVPLFMQTLFEKILAGDTDAISLMGTPRALLLHNDTTPPTAIRAQYYRYQFSSPQSPRKDQWWQRSEVPGSAPQLFASKSHQPPRNSAASRPVLLGGSVMGFTVCLAVLLSATQSTPWMVVSAYGGAAVGFLGFFLAVLGSDYSTQELDQIRMGWVRTMS
eukprot:TRINITY_DN19658_c0_g1_i2.p1 TRINITY_DN19658_c0_g1~~TRINITY_DN19658_c0_g1_i2.p1  ORF type:complete len:704 (+),score=123.07 TRINITY_DN19658_c0_g1_i2:171-2282(+)